MIANAIAIPTTTNAFAASIMANRNRMCRIEQGVLGDGKQPVGFDGVRTRPKVVSER